MKLLAIRFARLGDVLLLLPALTSIKGRFPSFHLTLLTGHRCAPIAEMCPAIDEVIAVDRVAMRDGPRLKALGQLARLVRDVRQKQFDVVIDFHSFRETNLLTLLSGAPVRIGIKRDRSAYWGFCFSEPGVPEDKSIHVSEMFERVAASLPSRVSAQVAPVGHSVRGPVLHIPDLAMKPDTLVLYVDAPVPDRIWPPERFAEVADFAIDRLEAKVVVISSPTGAGLADRVRDASRHPGQIELLTDLSLRELAATIASARLLVSNDTGPMHIGPAVGTPTLGLFSVGYPEHFRPIGPADSFLRGRPIEKIAVNEVVAKVGLMWPIAGRDLPR
jgi:ADP-heptose:LPS heptosyltransferase